jgi:alanine racemase
VTELPGLRPVWGEVDLDAVRANVRVLADLARPAALLAVVKADAYGHGAVPVARAALEAGATWLGVALVEEGAALRDAGIDAPILVLSEPAPAAADAVVANALTPVVYTPAGIEALAKAVVAAGRDTPLRVHLKVDTGMHRAGCTVDAAPGLVDAIAHRPELVLEGICTHFAVADEPGHAYTDDQVTRFDALLDELDATGARPGLVHAANSAGLLTHPRHRYDLVRVGIALYGVPPSDALEDRVELAPVLSLRARVAHVKELPAGARVSYGLRYELERPGTVATVPVGYADGVPRNLGLLGGEVLVHGRRFPIAGTVTMDQLMVDVGDEPVEVGDDVVLLGRQGDEEITAAEWAARLGTIAYEIVTGIGPRVPRRYLG